MDTEAEWPSGITQIFDHFRKVAELDVGSSNFLIINSIFADIKKDQKERLLLALTQYTQGNVVHLCVKCHTGGLFKDLKDIHGPENLAS